MERTRAGQCHQPAWGDCQLGTVGCHGRGVLRDTCKHRSRRRARVSRLAGVTGPLAGIRRAPGGCSLRTKATRVAPDVLFTQPAMMNTVAQHCPSVWLTACSREPFLLRSTRTIQRMAASEKFCHPRGSSTTVKYPPSCYLYRLMKSVVDQVLID